MLMADTMAVFFVILGLVIALVSLIVLVRGLWPVAVRASADRLSRGLVAPFAVGFPLTGVVMLVAAVCSNIAGRPGVLLAGGVLSVFLLFALTGIAGLATTIGERLETSSDAGQPWRAVLRGAIVLALSGLMPILGWFVVLPVALVIGAGASTLAAFRRRTPRSASGSSPADSSELVFGTPVSNTPGR